VNPPLKYREGYKYQVYEDYTIRLPFGPERIIETKWFTFYLDGTLVIRAGYAWDGASGPTYDTKSSIVGSLVHDVIYECLRLGLLPPEWREKADEILEVLCRSDGMIPVRAEVWHDMVRIFAASSANTKNDRPVLVAP
jgi:hypothetical protein